MNSGVGELPALTCSLQGKRVTQDRGDRTTAQYHMLIADCSAEQ